MVVLKCENGFNKRIKKPCDYEIRYRDSQKGELIATARAVGGFDCPACGKNGLRLKQTKKADG